MHQHLLVALTGIVLFDALAQWLSWKLKIPAILFVLRPDAMFGELLFPIVSLAVAVILFEGSLTLRFEEVRGLSAMIRRLISVGMLASWAVASVAARVFVGFDWSLAALFGALVVTGPTVIVPLLRAVRPKASITTVLRWEGIVIDSVGALLAVLVYQFVITRPPPAASS
jgi:NhaP-type Na+/H+ or K+/H+ antiporter